MELCFVRVKPAKRHKLKAKANEEKARAQNPKPRRVNKYVRFVKMDDQHPDQPLVYLQLPNHAQQCPCVQCQAHFVQHNVKPPAEEKRWVRVLSDASTVGGPNPYITPQTSRNPSNASVATQGTTKIHRHHGNRYQHNHQPAPAQGDKITELAQIYVIPSGAEHLEIPVVQHRAAVPRHPHYYMAHVPENATMQDIETALAPQREVTVMSRLESSGRLVRLSTFRSPRELDRRSLQLEVFDREMEDMPFLLGAPEGDVSKGRKRYVAQ